MKFGQFTQQEFIAANWEYFLNSIGGEVINTVNLKRPKVSDCVVAADLHTHPYISSRRDLYDTLDILVRNQVGLCAMTVHGTGNEREMTYWQVKDVIKEDGLSIDLGFEDHGQAFTVKRKGRQLTLLPAYEISVYVPGVNGTMDIIALMADKKFTKAVTRQAMCADDFLDICHDHKAITIAAHPYTVHDPYGPGKFFKFRLATEDERSAIAEHVFPHVDCIDLVATNVAWMTKSNRLVMQDYHGKPLANSDAHSTSHYTRMEIGRAGNIFQIDFWNNGQQLREQLRKKISEGDFTPYLNYTPSLQFLFGVAFGNLSTNLSR